MCAVNRVQLGDLLDYEQPTRYIVSSTDYDDAYDTPVLTAGQTFILGYTNETEGIYKAGKSNPVIIFDDFVTSFYLVDFNFKVKSSALKILKPKKNVNIYYVYYAMLGINFVPKEHARHWISKYSQFEIAYPSLAKQQEIVSQLDTFTTLIYSLESELDMRRKQYEHYRNQLLDFEGVEGVEWKETKDICIKICSGGTPLTSNQDYYNGTIPWLRTQEVDWGYVYDTKIKITREAINNSSAKMIPADCVIIAMYGATAAKCCINKIPLSTNQACCNLEVNNELALYKFVYYWFCKEYAKLKAMGEGSQNNISGNKIKGYLIPVPPKQTQQQIVEKLDAFEQLIQSLETEIKLRKQQYEYYREKLLTFD